MKWVWLGLVGLVGVGAFCWLFGRPDPSQARQAARLRAALAALPSKVPATLAPSPRADASPGPTPSAALRAAQAYFDAHIGRLRQIAFTDYPQALERRKALSARCDAIKKFGRDYYDRYKSEYGKTEKALENRIGSKRLEEDPDLSRMRFFSLILFLADGLHDQTPVVEDATVSDMLRELVREPVTLSGLKQMLAEAERKGLSNEDAARRVESAQSDQDLTAFLETESVASRALLQETIRKLSLNPEEAAYVTAQIKATMMKQAANEYQDLPDIAHKKLYDEYDKTLRELRGLMDQLPEDSADKRVMLTDLADLYTQMRQLGKG